jgi:hypothetical protein
MDPMSHSFCHLINIMSCQWLPQQPLWICNRWSMVDRCNITYWRNGDHNP